MRALLLVRRGAPLTRSHVHTLRRKGFEPFVLSSLPSDGGAQFRRMCEQIEVEYSIAEGVAITSDEVAEVVKTVDGLVFCLTQADSLRPLMAEANRLLGAPDVPPHALVNTLDKHLMRRTLCADGLSGLDSVPVTDPTLRQRIAAGETFVVKPRRGVGSLCVGLAREWADVERLQRAFGEGPADADMMAEYFADNELIAESFFDGREISLEIIRQDGASVYAVDHDKALIEFGTDTVLERGMASPVTILTDEELARARSVAEQAMAVLGLTDGGYHVEMRVNADGVAEIVEINPRVGGGMVWESIHLQYDRSITDDWIDVLSSRPVAPLGERRCGSYAQLAYPREQRQLLGVDRNPAMPDPVIYDELIVPGDVPIAHREYFGALVLWRTELATHREEVAALVPVEYCSFVYSPGLSGRPVLLVLEPDWDTLRAAVAVDGVDVVVCHQGPVVVTPEYDDIRDGLALLVQVSDWSTVHSILETVAGAEIAGIMAPHDVTREAEALIRKALA
ncbi:ATP-grasp domain-containing protein [Kutzneria kofuensis]|uniref:Biotin carboxylase n=1 Tax=Kutzneria kofuensis TaxID=103725 RepID=A0A7W9NMG3_9PSEU|nr:ATP-grasp domain-containing protein [Kutzneria kofuensis]MBB5897323.1 biotin carboxylase [Kutzneria kofuensis]